MGSNWYLVELAFKVLLLDILTLVVCKYASTVIVYNFVVFCNAKNNMWHQIYPNISSNKHDTVYDTVIMAHRCKCSSDSSDE